METMALTIFCWAAANLVIATVWTAYCLWPRRDAADASVDGAQPARPPTASFLKHGALGARTLPASPRSLASLPSPFRQNITAA